VTTVVHLDVPTDSGPEKGPERSGFLPYLARKTGAACVSFFMLLVGVFACSTSALFLKKCESAPIVVAGARLLIAAIALAPVMWLNVRRSDDPQVISPRRLARAIPGAIMLSTHFILWAMGAKMTDAANATLVVNLNPIFLPFLMYFVNHERINRGEDISSRQEDQDAAAEALAAAGEFFDPEAQHDDEAPAATEK